MSDKSLVERLEGTEARHTFMCAVVGSDGTLPCDCGADAHLVLLREAADRIKELVGRADANFASYERVKAQSSEAHARIATLSQQVRDLEGALRGVVDPDGTGRPYVTDVMMTWPKGSNGPIAVAAYESLVRRLDAVVALLDNSANTEGPREAQRERDEREWEEHRDARHRADSANTEAKP